MASSGDWVSRQNTRAGWMMSSKKLFRGQTFRKIDDYRLIEASDCSIFGQRNNDASA